MPRSPLGDVFFDLDASSIKDEAKASLSTNATWLKRWTSTRISIEGHCDERGTAEYNLGLGERRADRGEGRIWWNSACPAIAS